MLDAALLPSRFSAFPVARDRFAEGRFAVLRRPASRAAFALLRVFSDALPFAGGGSFTPARRAFDRPIAIACSGERAPCWCSRTWCSSSRTNSPACVEADLPSRFACRARSLVLTRSQLPDHVELPRPLLMCRCKSRTNKELRASSQIHPEGDAWDQDCH